MKLHSRLQIHTLNNISLPLPANDTDSTEEESPLANDPNSTVEESPATSDPNSTEAASPSADDDDNTDEESSTTQLNTKLKTKDSVSKNN